ncbi:hypothetical protein Cgig2_026708 [Carnegiea gigantea]|uniref:Plant bHLH transcription factor ACT-like domain-containing protein n=1 Tax=Carnegiea gigantea TaxID=171969 RepID=A0A9Q1JVS7_9CARY|nr:hypothetical protein Cgig2_026708 [Carnegiea gigantea]
MELEQLLHSLGARKRIKHQHHHRDNHQEQPEKQPQPPEGGGGGGGNSNIVSINDLRGLLSFPSNIQHSNESTQQGSGCNSVSSMNSGGECGDEVQVTMVESHANVKIMAKKKPKQLLRLVAGFQGLRLSVLHLNVTTIHPSFLLYSFSLKVEEGCQANSVDDITAAANHILAQIQDEASGLL